MKKTYLISVFFIFSALAVDSLATDDSRKDCRTLAFRGSYKKTEDRQILTQQNPNNPAASGYLKASADYARWNPRVDEGDIVFPWSAFVLADNKKVLFDSPSALIKNLPARVEKINQRRMTYHSSSQPLALFFIAHEAKYSIFQPLLQRWIDSTTFQPDHAYSVLEPYQKIKFSVGNKNYIYEFDQETYILVIGGGSSKSPSHWQDDFTLSHEISHAEEFSDRLQWFPFFQEGRSDFWGYIYSETVSEHPLMAERKYIASPQNVDIEYIFNLAQRKSNGSTTKVSSHDIAGILSQVFYRTSEELNTIGQKLQVRSYFNRVARLLTYSSPWIELLQDDPSVIHRQLQDPWYDYDQVVEQINYLASVSLQWAVEKKLPIKTIESLGKIWNNAGATGPYKRWQVWKINAETNTVELDFLEEKYQDQINVPEEWVSLERLLFDLRSKGYNF